MNTPDPVHPYYRAILNAYEASGRAAYHQGSPAQARELLRSSLAAAPPQTGLPELDFIGDETVVGANEIVRVRRYRPRGKVLGTCMLLHAGGWVIGDLGTNDALARRLCAGAGCEVVNVDYRLAPEHPYPAALDDAFTVMQWCLARNPGPVVIAGESAGGNLAAACAIRGRETWGVRVAGQFLAYPVTDCAMDTASYRDVGSRNYLLSAADMSWFWDQYCPTGIDRRQPLASPLRVADASGLPPALIFVAELDPLHDEGLAYAKRLAAAGVEVKTRDDQGMLHGYLSAAGAVSVAAEAVQEAAEWIREHIQLAEGRQ